MSDDSPNGTPTENKLSRLKAALRSTEGLGSLLPGTARRRVIESESVALLESVARDLGLLSKEDPAAPSIQSRVAQLEALGRAFNHTLVVHEERLAKSEQSFTALRQKVAELGAHLSALVANIPTLERRITQVWGSFEHLTAGLDDACRRALSADIAQFKCELGSIQSGLLALSGQVAPLAADAAQVPALKDKTAELDQKIATVGGALELLASGLDETCRHALSPNLAGLRSELSTLHSDVLALSGRVDPLAFEAHQVPALRDKTAELQKTLTATRAECHLPSVEERDHFEKFYVAFEREFRGSEAEVLRKQSIHLGVVREALERTGLKNWLDLGCGRGEWLDLVASAGGAPLGVDSNPHMVELCRARELDVRLGDALSILHSCQKDSLAGVSAFHLIEHIPAHTFIGLVAGAFEALKPGGCLLLETPNPQNVIVGACNFYMDPTHKNPITPMTAEFVARYAGFSEVRVVRLSPFPRHAERDTLPTVTEREFCEFFYGPQDFAIVAFK